jgi:hypothetical protein
MVNKQKLLLALVKAKDEQEVQEVIENVPLLQNRQNWLPYGDNETNFNQVLNQQSNPVQALVEKPINSIDHILLKECKLRGIDPKGAKAPASIQQAVEEFFGIPKGNFSELTATERRRLAENIQIIAEGDLKKPNLVIYDEGEGQNPKQFRHTLLSLSKNNKLQIKFVQGQYCMGGTGVLPNCGQKKFQLVLSRKHPQLLTANERDEYGFTLVRKHTITIEEEREGYKSSWCEYFVDENGDIFSFEAEKLDLGLFSREMTYGTYIKLYDYHLPRPSDITLDLWRDLNQFLYHPPLPILLYEKRFKSSHALTKVMLGNRTRILIDERNSVRTTIPLCINSKKIGKMDVEVTVFKPEVKNREFIDKKSVILTRNGQVHGYFDRTFVAQEVKLPYLKDTMLVHVNCDSIPQNIREEIFMPSRDRYRESEATDELKTLLARELHQNEQLKRLNEERMNQLIYENKGDHAYVESVMRKIVQKDKSLLNLLTLKGNIDLKSLEGRKKKEQQEEKKIQEVFVGRRFPAVFKIKNGHHDEMLVKTIPLGGEGIINFETDVENEYLIRPSDGGEFILQLLQYKPNNSDGGTRPGTPKDVAEVFEVSRVGPYEGSIKLRLRPLDTVSVGDEARVSAKLTSPDGDKECIFQVKIGPRKEKEEKPVEEEEEYSLPQLIPVFKEANPAVPNSKTWDDPEFGWTGNDIVKLYQSSSEKSLLDAVAVNMDSFSLSQYIRTNRLAGTRLEAAKRVYEVGVFLTSIFLYSEVRKNQHDWKGIDPEDAVANLMKGYSKVILYLLLNEQLLKEIEEDMK